MTPRVCYFIQSHRDPEQIVRLVRTLRRGSERGRIVVHHDSAGCALDWAPLAALPDTHLFRSTGPQVRASFSCQAQPYLESIDRLEREGLEYDWLVNLTAQDYPVKPVAEIEAFLGTTRSDGFISWWDVESPESPWSRRKARHRYWYRYKRLPDRAEPALRALRVLTRVLPIHFYLPYGAYLGVRTPHVPFRDGFRCYGGRTWFSLRRRVALYLRDFLAEHQEVEAHYRGTVAPEESIVQTVLVNASRFALVNDDLRYIDYTNAWKGHPRTLTVADLPLLAAGGWHFARKFDLAVDREVLDRIDRELLGIEPGG
ncbi:MAG TPA: beta-1,6-N-acetylglucosaminyltransferase [Thermoanaerobaculia bacterium]